MPVLAISGEHSRMKNAVYNQLKEAAEQLTGDVAPGVWSRANSIRIVQPNAASMR
jgi:hypothetical protein